jgi:hypothetical protein
MTSGTQVHAGLSKPRAFTEIQDTNGSGTPGELMEAAGIPPAATRAPLTG